MSDSEKQDKPTFSFKKINRKRAVRKQRNESSDDGSGKSDSDDGNVAVRQMVTKKKNNPMVQSTKRIKLGTTGVTNSSSDDNSDQDTASITVSYKSSRSGKREGPDDMGATSVVEIDTQADRDAQAILERSLQLQKVIETLSSFGITAPNSNSKLKVMYIDTLTQEEEEKIHRMSVDEIVNFKLGSVKKDLTVPSTLTSLKTGDQVEKNCATQAADHNSNNHKSERRSSRTSSVSSQSSNDHGHPSSPKLKTIPVHSSTTHPPLKAAA
uniref:Uncharacterized protein n=1 Tax=Biomphalaria glabrata TaxID=6526 RepID=A0A2C9LZV3_BIOGL